MITPRDARAIQRLLSLSRDLDNGLRCKHVCCIMKGKRILSLAHNQPITDAFHFKYSRRQAKTYRHAESACIKQVQFRDDLDSVTLYVARVDNNGEQANSKPCPSCERAIKDNGIKRVVYSTERGIEEMVP